MLIMLYVLESCQQHPYPGSMPNSSQPETVYKVQNNKVCMQEEYSQLTVQFSLNFTTEFQIICIY